MPDRSPEQRQVNDSTSPLELAAHPETRKTRIQRFGPKDWLLGFKTEAAAETVGIGAILWGMGLAQLRVARQLSALGIPSLQVKLAHRDFSDGHYSHIGVALVQAAMDRLAAQQNVDTFVLMANCAFANISLNTAIADSRICMLALTNPYLTRHQKRELLRWSFARKALSGDGWLRLLRGKVDFRSALRSAISLSIGRPRKSVTDEGVTSEPSRSNKGIGKDMILPADLDEKLRQLCDRGVETYCACSATEPGLLYLKKHYRKTLNELRARGALVLATIDTDVHLMGTNSEGALMHSDAIGQWLSRSARLSALKSAP